MTTSVPITESRHPRFKAGRYWRTLTIAILTAVLYADTAIGWARQCWEDDSYSHGLLVAPLSLYLVWKQRLRLARLPAVPDGRGMLLVAAGCLACLMGRLGAELFLSRSSFVILAAGLIWTFRSGATLRHLAFPLLLGLSAIPIPVIVYNSLAAPLQLLASQAATWATQALGISVYRDGNIIQLAGTSLGVAEACSGLRSLASLSVAALLLGYLECRRIRTRVLLLLLALPIAVFINIIRVAGTAVLAEHDPALAMGFYHSITGWLVFVGGFVILYGATRCVRRILERGRTRT
jgi:exosortase